MSKTFKLLIMIIGCLLLGSLVILYIFKWPDRAYQIWFLCFSIYIPFYVFYAEKKGLILGNLQYINLNKNPTSFRFHQVLYMISSMTIFAIVEKATLLGLKL